MPQNTEQDMIDGLGNTFGQSNNQNGDYQVQAKLLAEMINQ